MHITQFKKYSLIAVMMLAVLTGIAFYCIRADIDQLESNYVLGSVLIIIYVLAFMVIEHRLLRRYGVKGKLFHGDKNAMLMASLKIALLPLTWFAIVELTETKTLTGIVAFSLLNALLVGAFMDSARPTRGMR